MGGGGSKKPAVHAEGESSKGLKPTFSSRQAVKQIKRIERTAPRQKNEDEGQLMVKWKGKEVILPYAYLSQTGYYPDELDKPNQDALMVIEDLGSADHKHAFFGVFDGHGKVGDLCSNFARLELWEALADDDDFKAGNVFKGLINAHVRTNEAMHEQERLNSFSDMMSGTTAISAVLKEDMLYVSNLGDSRAIAIVETEAGKYEFAPLSIDQTPFRKDERERVKKTGARVLTMAQLEGLVDPGIQEFGNEDENDGDPPRLWSTLGNYPGTAFTRSLGDRVAEEIGVTAVPEVLERRLTKSDKFILLASDGVFEFITSQGVVDIFSRFRDNLRNACKAIVAEAYRQWLQFEVRTDDITCMIIDVRELGEDDLTKDQIGRRKGSWAIDNLAEELREQLLANMAEMAESGVVSLGEGKSPDRADSHDQLMRKTSIKLDSGLKAGAGVFSKAPAFMGMELRPVRRKVANNVGVVPFDPAELDGYELPVFEKSDEEKNSIQIAIQNNYLFAHLSDEQLGKAIMAMEKVHVKEGDIIIKQFDKGDKFYVAASGRYAVEVAVNKTTTDPSGKQVMLHGQYEEPREVMEYNCDSGGFFPSFGELALMYNKPRAATIRAVQDGQLWALERKAFHSVLMRDSAHRLVKVLRKVKAFESLTYNEIARLVDLLTEVHYKPGETIVRQGDPGDSFYVIKKGQAQVFVEDEDGSSQEVMQLAEYEYFGERALLNSAPRAASVVAKEDVTCLMIRKGLFDEVLGRLQAVLKNDGKEREHVAKAYLEVDSLDQLKVFPGEIPYFSGHLFRCALRTMANSDGNLCTVRRIVLPEEESERAETEERLAKELEILRKVSAPLLVSTFNHPELPLVRFQLFRNEIVTDMQSIITDRPLDPSSNMLKYSIKIIALALMRLHEHRGILSRGVAPEGILMDANGELLLTDFRYSKRTNGARTFTACGTPEYMAPEQIKGAGHGFPVDWWSLGILMCELCTGSTPWANKSEVEIYEAITDPLTVQIQIGSFARMLEAPGVNLLHSLLADDPEKRMAFTHEDEFEMVPFLARVRTKESPLLNFAQQQLAKLQSKDSAKQL